MQYDILNIHEDIQLPCQPPSAKNGKHFPLFADGGGHMRTSLKLHHELVKLTEILCLDYRS